jgi:leucyl/phenylalanyl-tRNA--protein transferase
MSRDELSPEVLLSAYARGYFPMGSDDEPGVIRWYDPNPRGVMPIDGFHVSRSLLRHAKRRDFTLTLNRDFAAVVDGCAARDTTWITGEIKAAYTRLHDIGYAHSAEVRCPDGALVGGMYGVAIGRAFFGESMFSAETGGSKMALGGMAALLGDAGFTLFDTQFLTSHLASLGGIEIRRATYKRLLATADKNPERWHAPTKDYSVAALLQRISQTS